MTRSKRRTLALLSTLGILLAVGLGMTLWRHFSRTPPLPMFGGNAQRTGFTQRVGPLTEPAVLWEARPGVFGGVFSTQPIVDTAGHLYSGFGAREGGLVSYDADGRERWRFSQTTSHGFSVPVLHADKLIVGFRDGSVRSLERATGELSWTTYVESGTTGIISSPVVDRRGHVYVSGLHREGLFKLESQNGKVVWRFALNGECSSPALSVDEVTVYLGMDGDVYALETSNGNLKWKFSEKGAHFGWTSPMVGADGTIYHQDRTSGALLALRDKQTAGEERWRFDPQRPGGAPRLPSMDDDRIYLGATGPQPLLIALDFNGKEKWREEFSAGAGQLVSVPIVSDGAVYVSVDGDGGVYCFARTDGSLLWRKQVATKAGEFADALALGDGGVLYVSTDGTPDHPGEAVLVALRE